jgi:hypothetical protein
MSEVRQIPIPIVNYFNLIRDKKSPYYDLILFLVADMEKNLKQNKLDHGIIYTINPRQLKDKIDEEISSKKLTPINISRTILALLYGSKLEKDEDYYVTTSSGGRKNYHIKINHANLSSLQVHLY